MLGKSHTGSQNGHLRISKMSQRVQGAVLERFPRDTGVEGQGHSRGCHCMVLHDLKWQRGWPQRPGSGRRPQESDRAGKVEENVPCLGQLSLNSSISLLPAPSRYSEL